MPDVDLSFRDQVVLVGPNDVGKTCILQCIHFAVGASMGSLYQNLGSKDVRDSTRPATIAVDFTDFDDNERAIFPDEISISTDGKETLGILLEIEVSSGDEDDVAIRRSFPYAGHNRQPARAQLAAIGWQYLPAIRAGGAEGIEGRTSPLKALLQTVDFGTERAVVTNAIDALNDILRTSAMLADLRAEMAEHLSAASPNDVDRDDLSFRSAAGPDEMLRILSLWLDRDGNVRPIGEQSDGLNALASIALYDLSSSTSNIVAIDEPETHLHPASQRALATLLAQASNQKLISTHSPYIVQQFDPEYVIAFSATRQCRQLPTGALSKTEKIMTQWWIASRLEALTAKRVLYVEGTADRIIVEACIRISGLSLDKMSISIVELGGADGFKAANRFFGASGFNIDFLGLVDEDHEKEWADEIGIAIADLPNQDIYVCRKDLEEEYVAALGTVEAQRALVNSGTFSTAQIVRSCGVATAADLTTKDLTEFCGKGRHKVQAALAVSIAITDAHVAKMNALAKLVDRLRGLS